MADGLAAPNAQHEITAKFHLELDGIAKFGFDQCTVPMREWGSVEGRTGLDGLTVTKSSGLKKVENIKCVKKLRAGGVAEVMSLLEWFEAGSTDKRNGAIINYDRAGNELIRWNFRDGWVMRHDEINLDASQENEALIFSFEIAVSDIVPGV